ncbi:MAG: hypothetical protein UZ17_ACD001000151 [Acidobacteria bacterium OLB17]|nr:MAG: hypothetical protein UZ17_ACD001000151 [Acidobacteria bacterium OLB17]
MFYVVDIISIGFYIESKLYYFAVGQIQGNSVDLQEDLRYVSCRSFVSTEPWMILDQPIT